MRHALTAEGYGIKLRPVRQEDAPFIVWLRNLDHVKGWVGDSATEIADQERWLNNYFEREGDYYFLIETLSGLPLGTCGMYNLRGAHAEIGRLAVRPSVSATYPACLLLLDLFYMQMGIQEVEAICLTGNFGVLTTSRRFGFNRVKTEYDKRFIGGKELEVLHFIQRSDEWPHVRKKLFIAVRRAELTIRKWEETYWEQNVCAATIPQS